MAVLSAGQNGEAILTTAWSSLARLAHFASVITRQALAMGFGSLARRIPGLRGHLAQPASGPRRLCTLLETLGGTFIKFGQVLALQPDILPRHYCDALFDLMDKVPPFGFGGVEKTFREDFGQHPDELFDSFEQEPIASASIGQVHVAWLDGRKLAVKVQHPRARRDFGGDIRLMKWTVTWIRRLGLNQLEWLAVALDEFLSWTGEELDFRSEARFMDRLAASSRDRDIERVPEVEWPLTSARILTAEFLDGPTLLQYLRSLEEDDTEIPVRLEESGFDPERFAENMLGNFVNDVFANGVFHADLHPANLLILENNVVGYVDFGISGVVSEYGRYHLVSTILALTRADIEKVADGLLAIADLDTDSDTEGFRRALRDLSEEWFLRDSSGGGFEKLKSYTEILLDTLHMSRRAEILPHPEAMRYMRSVITLDGLIGRFAPTLDRDATLETDCAELLESTALGAPLAFDQWVDWLWAGTRLARDGASRLDRALDRFENRVTRETRSSPARRSSRALHLASVTAVLTTLVLLLREPPHFGLNLFTAELTVIGGSLALLTWELFRWRPSRR